MNERIKELTVEANDQTGNKFDLNHKPLDAFLGKFAELIVRECSTLAFDGPKGILEHFGVEE